MPSAASMLSRSLPACPTNGSPFASSSSPGPSPTNSHSARRSPTPGTVLLRERHSPHAVHDATSASNASQSSAAIRSRRAAGSSAATIGRDDGLAGEAPRADAVSTGPSCPAVASLRRRHSGASLSSRRISSRVAI
jgi:hypothetical protein